ncbi:MAG TPA: Fe-S protein assembly co-chaperone HscB [Polyangiaceae bacterium]|jgi:molecular chaperone HscB|nr:Fe-S protein assembly co-chaperone HscB [Polyangiaceae bacterium]
MEPLFTIDLGALEQRHRELSRTLHPDRFTGRPASERRQALSQAIEVNEAFRALRDPVRRGEAILRRLGVNREEGEEPKPDPEFLMDVMERREALSEARRSKQIARVRELASSIRELDGRAREALGRLFTVQPLDPDAVERRLGELRYYRRFLEEAAAIEDEIA